MNVGGIETMLMELYRNIDRSKFQFDFVVHSKGENFYEKEIYLLGGKIYRVPFISKHPIEHCFRFYKLLKEHPEYRIIHIHTTYSIMYVDAKIAKSLERIVIIHSHNSGASKKRTFVHELLKRPFSSLADYRLACSGIAAEWMYPLEHLSTVTIWKNAICLDGFSFNEAVRKSMREKYGAENNLIIGTVGRLSYQKNQNLLLRIFRQVANQHPNAMLWIVGDGEDRSSLEQQVKDLQLSDKVRFFGSRSNVADFLMAFDVFVLTSRWEGWGIVLMEAQATGLPVIVPLHIDPLIHITKNVSVVEDYKSINMWADTIIRIPLALIDRHEQFETVKQAGFDIHTQVLVATSYYESLCKEL